MDMTDASLNSNELGFGRVTMFLTSWFFVIGSLLLVARLAIHARRFTQAFVDAVKPSHGIAADQTAGSSYLPGPSSGRYQVQIDFGKAVMADDATQFHYQWKLIQNQSGFRITKEDKEVLDRKVQAYCKHVVEDPTVAAGDHRLLQWFN
jgi:hypothetical protein